jgi:hypothetical protein
MPAPALCRAFSNFVEQRFGFSQIRQLEAFGEPLIDLSQNDPLQHPDVVQLLALFE